MPNELYVVPLMALLDAVDTDGVAVRRVARVTPAEEEQKQTSVSRSTPLPVWRGVGRNEGRSLPVEVVHGVAGVTGNLVQALASVHRLFDGVLIVHYFVI